MNDEEPVGVWTTLEPTARQRQRIDARVLAWLEARDTPLLAEWLGLFRAAPFPTAGLFLASGISLATAPPLIWLVTALI